MRTICSDLQLICDICLILTTLRCVGICDCCDGSDEASLPNIHCPDACDNDVTSYRKVALQQYRTIQAGLQVCMTRQCYMYSYAQVSVIDYLYYSYGFYGHMYTVTERDAQCL